MVQSCDEKRGGKLHEKNSDGRSQQMPQSRMTKEAMGRHHRLQQDTKPLRLKKEHTGGRKRSGDEGSERLTPPLGGINSSRKEIHADNAIANVIIKITISTLCLNT